MASLKGCSQSKCVGSGVEFCNQDVCAAVSAALALDDQASLDVLLAVLDHASVVVVAESAVSVAIINPYLAFEEGEIW